MRKKKAKAQKPKRKWKMVRLTKRKVDSLHGDDPKGKRYFDSVLRGFVLNVYPRVKVFEIRYTYEGRRKYYRIGEYGHMTVEQARKIAKQKLGSGGDPAAERAERRNMKTFREWVEGKDGYLADVKKRKKHPEFDVRYLQRYAMKRWATKYLDEITVQDIAAFQRKMGENGHLTQGNRALQSVSGCLGAAVKRKIIKINNALEVEEYRENPPRSRVLTEAEDKAIMEALAEEDVYTVAAILIAFETGVNHPGFSGDWFS